MSKYELRINGRLVDLGKNFSVRLNRQLISPAELNTKDAQMSFSITLPRTTENRETFKYADVEEVSGKFNGTYTADLIALGVPIFKGYFRMTEIKDGFKGNLYVPAPKSVKDVFGDLNLNQFPTFPLTFDEFATSVTAINTAALTATQDAIFPYVLYGLLPKVPTDKAGNDYTARDLWDDTVRVGMQDIPPSPNVLRILQHLFDSQGYTLQGTAFSDDKLSKLYMSYKNPSEYIQPWNWGIHGHIELDGVWNSIQDQRPTTPTGTQFERGVNTSQAEGYQVYSANLFDSTNAKITVEFDPGGNVLQKETLDLDGVTTWAQTQVRIPASGFYKVHLRASVRIQPLENYRFTDPATGVQHLGGFSDDASNSLDDSIQEIRLVRDRRQADFNLQNARLNGTFYRDNQPQNDVFDEANSPKYFPQVTADGQLNFVDLAQDKNHVLGFSFGMKPGDRSTSEDFQNPKGNAAQMLAAKPAQSWNSLSNEFINKLAVNSSGWWKYGRRDDAPTEGVDWELTSKYAIDLSDAPVNFAKRAQFDGTPDDENWTGEGELNAVVWFDAGELVSVATVAPEGRFRVGFAASKFGWVNHSIKFHLEINPYRVDSEWLKVDLKGNGTAAMSWNDDPNFDTFDINLVGFLPSNVKVNDFVDNFVKAFNLKLYNVSPGVFALDVKQAKTTATNRFVDLDKIASVRDKANTPLGLPSAYKVGFTIDTAEEGYVVSQDDGGGEYSTGVTGGTTTEQKSSFSYNWFKNITKDGETLALPIISKHEVWQDTTPYAEGVLKRFTDQGIRFWYFDGLLDSTFMFNGVDMSLAKVSNEIPGASILNYKNKPKTILRNYFTLLINGGSHYTELEAYLTPLQYNQLDGSFMARFNGDLYFVAELSGYDPEGRNKTSIKLIRAI
jgi:hypothetical protein